MRLKGNEMIVHRGETFTIDKVVVNRDGSPFIVSSEYDNPHILISVSSTRYDLENRYKVNWWLDLKDSPRFLYTQPKKITVFDITQTVDDQPGEYLYYVDDVTKCKYFDENDEWHDYEFRIIHHFVNSVTRDWVEQSYVYSIQLVSGNSTDEYIKNLYNAVFEIEPDVDKTTEELYYELKNKDENLVENLDFTRPIVGFDVVQVILEPTKLTVMSDINGGF